MKLNPIRVHIKNYQSIGDIEFEVAGFTCITGKTNIGKSAILRAISGALLNKPVTNSVRAGNKSCLVKMSSDADGRPWGFTWEKAERGLNRYTIDGKAEKLENVGQRQPEPISTFGFGSVRIGDKDLYPWYADQWSPLFLLNEGGPTVTQFISEISGLNVLQEAMSLALKGKRKALEELKVSQAEAVQVEEKLAKIDNLPNLEEMLKELEHQQGSILKYEARIGRGKELHADISKLTKQTEALGLVGRVHVPKDDMADQLVSLEAMRSRLEKLEAAAKAVIALRGKTAAIPELPQKEWGAWDKIRKFDGMDRLRSSVRALEPIGSAEIPDLPDPKLVSRLAGARQHHRQIGKLRQSINKLEVELRLPEDLGAAPELAAMARAKAAATEIEHLKAEIAKLDEDKLKTESEVRNVLKELGEIPACPTCSRPILSGHSHEAG